MIKQTEIQMPGAGMEAGQAARRGLWWEEELQRKSKAKVRRSESGQKTRSKVPHFRGEA